MRSTALPQPAREEIRQHILTSLRQYWEKSPECVARLPVTELEFPDCHSALRLQSVTLPDWAESCGVEGCLLVPAEACADSTDWRNVDWWLAAFLLLEAWHERSYEQRNGPIHSYSHRLEDWDDRVWRHAWVNRIAIFLRLWAAEVNEADAEALLGPMPVSTIMMTHDVDALSKTLPIRIKQGAFNLLNSFRQLGKGRLDQARQSLRRATRFFFGQEDWWLFDNLMAIETTAGFRSRFHFYADTRRKTPVRWLFDPGYDVENDRVRELIKRLEAGGWQIGLHQSFDAWRSDTKIREQRMTLDGIFSAAVTTCRQHWLRFSWKETWAAQEAAGLEEDTTLMFNNRMGFRSAAAIVWKPWNPQSAQTHGVRAVPTVLMDSHAYDYQVMTSKTRRAEIRHWLQEVKSVGGRCAILWHPHTLTRDYGWGDGFQDCIDVAAELNICVHN